MRKILVLALLLCLGAAPQAFASDYGFSLFLSGPDNNVPYVTVQNTSDLGYDITGFSMTIGDAAKSSFDYSGSYSVSDAATTYAAADDGANAGTWYSSLNFSFTNFGVGDFFIFKTDIDGVNSNLTKDYRTVLFNNGDALNSLLTVTFADGTVLNSYMPDYISSSLPVYAHSDGISPTPIPGAIWLLGSGFLGLIGLRRRAGA